MSKFALVRALDALVRNGVRFIIIGGVAGRAWGSPSMTDDLDICYDRRPDNLEALVRALVELKATLRGAPAGLPFQLDARTLRAGDSFTFDTIAGSFDCLGTPTPTTGYDELLVNATEVEIENLRVLVCSLDDLIRMKRAANRPKDRIELEILAAVKEEREKLR
ncbi:MAG TPA: hypothetical protein VEU30_04505 [Thermoanaerobaculia bacterium]|nr:hypothetical protein [Thermoanaerobaculia bacterium]